jgi:pimeloyl-ACP methyl ester carboxylesterase/membrane protein DedA with SNARE-associated domain
VLGYLALLLISHAVILLRGPARAPDPAGAVRAELSLPMMNDQGEVPGRTYKLSVLQWSPAAPEASRLPVVLLHGCPSKGGADFARFAPEIAARGSLVIAPDLPSSGASGRDAVTYSIRASARSVLAAMDQMAIERAHVLGWSQGGGVAINMAEIAPERVASLTLLASVGAQETEGSGSHFFEHMKYRLGHFCVAWLPEALPHFGLLGQSSARWTLLRPFMDSDQRPLKAIMQRLATPTLILHGRHDFLVPAWSAEEHHEMMPASTLVMIDGDHFMPIGDAMPVGGKESRRRQFNEAVAHTLAFMNEQEGPRAASRYGESIFAPAATHVTQRLGGFKVSRDTPWWLIILIIGAATMISEDLTIITVGILMAGQAIDWGVALVGCFIAIVVGDVGLWLLGRTLGRRVLKFPLIKRVLNEKSLEKWGRVLDTHTGKAVMLSRCLPGTRMPTFIAAGILANKPQIFLFWVAVAAFIWTPFLLGMTMLVGPGLLEVFRTVFHGPWAFVAAIIVLYAIIRLVGYETTEMGRDRLKADVRRLVTPEFWPAWAFYIPWIPYFCWLSLRHWGFNTFTAANPGIPAGGGMIGESKAQILSGFSPDHGAFICPWVLITEDADAGARAGRAIEAIRATPALGGFPVILKPDQAFRGYGLKLARNEDDVRAYFKTMHRPVMVQAYHAGPYELGVLWSRIPTPGKPVDEWPGEVFSATDKEFPVVIGDGKRTLELLIWHHPRFRMQADVFCKRFEVQTDRVLAPGERFPLVVAGNHCQGTMFTDGMPKITPAMAARIDAICQAYRGAGGARIDFGRFDLRYADPAAIARGEQFSIIEFNGTSSESTSMYDPTKRTGWSYALLMRHWKRLFVIGSARRREGSPTMSLGALVSGWRAHRKSRTVPTISD